MGDQNLMLRSMLERPLEFRPKQQGPHRIAFFLIPEFPIYAVIPATEALRIANQSSGQNLYDWSFVSVDGASVRAGNGMMVAPDASIADDPAFSTLIVCAGNHPTQYLDRRLLNWLRKLERHGVTLGALDTGTFALAAAGLMDGYRMTLHWEATPLFREHYPDLAVKEQVFVIDRNRITCAGGAAATDMTLHLIALDHGAMLAQTVANGMVHERLRPGTDPQRAVLDAPVGTHDPVVLRAIRLMENNLEAPLQPDAVAAKVGLTTRQLERLFRRKLNDSPARYYLKVRLQAARNLLFYSDVSIQDVALSCGFSGADVFSRTFREHFGQSPRHFRSDSSTDRLHRFHPEFRQQLAQ
jgi:AraC family transcriptional regulator, glycine betaine-responsive activator